MRAQDFEWLYRLEESYWWFVGMRQITESIVRGQVQTASPLRLLDAGCGTGLNLRHLGSLGPHRVWGIDISEHAVDGLIRRGSVRIVRASVTDLPFPRGFFDHIFSFDVLCQLPQDRAQRGFSEMDRVLKHGGYLFIRVPAFEWLRSSHDEELGTVYRYTRAEVVRQLEGLGFQVPFATYANTILFPLAVVRRMLKHLGIGAGTDVRPLPPRLGWLDPVFRRALEWEAAWIGAGRRFPIGLSVICYARKK